MRIGTDRSARAALASAARSERDAEESAVADVITLVLLAALRGGTLVLAVAATTVPHRGVIVAALVVLTAESVVVFAVAAVRVRRRITPALDWRVAVLETVAAVAALFVVAHGTPPEERALSTFWIEQYTVISCLVIAAAAPRAGVGAAAAACVGVAYALSVLAFDQGSRPLSAEARATTFSNALLYVPFFAVGAVGFAVLRSIIDQNDELRRLLGRLATERARIAAATSAYRIGHDIPKALLREVRRGTLRADQLRPWAERYSSDLAAAVSDGDHAPIDLRRELAALADAFAAAGTLHADLDGVGELPEGAPALLIAEATRELLNNAFYHAYGYPVTLAARAGAAAVEVVVHNDGPGIDPAVLASAWARKQNTVHQLEIASGSYRIDSTPGSQTGTTITLRWPATPRD
jgi:signal transduction histidine kinase